MRKELSTKRIFTFHSGQAEAGKAVKELVGGKGASLGEMTRAGLNVPPGFTISALCCHQYHEASGQWPAGLRDEVRSHMAELEQLTNRRFGQRDNPLLVAVRSGAAVSMPGMMDTVLNVGLDPDSGDDMPTDPCDKLFQAIEAVFQSWNNERAVAYRQHHNIDGLLGTAVNVQVMCPSEVSGILFTAHPVNPELRQMVVEASLGLGDAVVLGKVTPDHFIIDRDTGEILKRRISNKAQSQAFHSTEPAPALTDEQLGELFQLGKRVEEYFQTPCDIEWGLADGQFYLLQARAIKWQAHSVCSSCGTRSVPATLSPSSDELEQVRQEEIARLRKLAAPEGTVWSRYNLAEILPEPTPMTWAIVRQFMSGRGGFGQMYRDLGFDPDPALDEIGIFDLVCGRPYCNLSREPKMQYRQLPFEHPFDKLKQQPTRALYPVAVFNPRRAGWRFWLLIPLIFVKLLRSSMRLQRISQTFAEKFQKEIVPPFLGEVAREEKADLGQIESTALLERLQYWIKRTLYDFGRESLKPTALAGIAMGNLERFLVRHSARDSRQSAHAQSPQEARRHLRDLVMGVRPEAGTDLAGAMDSLVRGQLDEQTFLEKFGHRGQAEMELSSPRWAEQPAVLGRMIKHDISIPARSAAKSKSPLVGLNLSSAQRQAFERELQSLHAFLKLRETAKHHLMRGYFLIRKILVELDRRYHLDGGIFFLTPEELPELAAGKDISNIIAQRRRRRELLLKLPVPPVLFSDDLETIGRPPLVPKLQLGNEGAKSMQGVPLSAGVAEGTALVLNELPETIPAEEAYILVCPTTDPAWMPLFVKARGLVMETGGMLSHGAIVAREFGLPAVAGLPEIHHRIKTGQRILVDGSTGKVNILE